MSLELRMLLKVSIHAIKSPTGGWNASFMDKGYKASGSTPFQAISNYMEWVEARLNSGDSDEVLAADFGIEAIWIPSLRAVLSEPLDQAKEKNLSIYETHKNCPVCKRPIPKKRKYCSVRCSNRAQARKSAEIRQKGGEG